MRQFKIRELEAFSGIKAHTIRIWEQRYAIFKPGRTTGNMRRYSLEEVKRLLDISLMLDAGYKISALAGMDEVALKFGIESLTSEKAKVEVAIQELIILMYTSEIEEFEDVLDAFVLVSGINAALTTLILPFLRRINLLSYHDTSPETHFVVPALRKKIILGIEGARPLLMTDKKALLFLTEGEHFDLLLLYAAYILKRKGFRVLYLGTNISIANLHGVLVAKKPEMVMTYLTREAMKSADALIALSTAHRDSDFLAVTAQPPDPAIDTGALQFLEVGAIETGFEESILKGEEAR